MRAYAAPFLIVISEAACIPPPLEAKEKGAPAEAAPVSCDFTKDPRLRTPRGRLNFLACGCFSPEALMRERREKKRLLADALIREASWQTDVPDGVINAVWRNESMEVHGDRGRAGGCSAREQYLIMRKWKPKSGRANLAALERIAARLGRDSGAIQGSCGNSTMKRRGGSFGGALGPMQVLAANWHRDPDFRDKDPLDLCQAMLFAGKKLRRNFDEHASWELAIRRYYGALSHPDSPAYFMKALERWRKWHARQ